MFFYFSHQQQRQEVATGVVVVAQPDEQGGLERAADPAVLGQDGGAGANGRPGRPGQRTAPRPHRLPDGLPDQTQAGLCWEQARHIPALRTQSQKS